MKKLSSFLGVLALLAFAPLAHANYVISYSLNGAAAVTCANSIDDTFASCFAVPTSLGSGVTVTQITGSSNSPGTPSLSDQSGSVVKISAAAPTTLDIWLAAQDFVAPTAPPALIYSSSLTLITGTGAGTIGLESCADTSNGTAPLSGSFCSGVGSPTLNNSFIYAGLTHGLADNNSATVSSPSASPYSLSQEVTLSLSAGSTVELQTAQSLTPTPEPASLTMVGAGLIGLAGLLRRKLLQA